MDFFRRFRSPETMVLVDPVMGDSGRAYGIYTENLRVKMLQLVSCAQVITPNLTEALLLLYGKAEMEERYVSLMTLAGEKRLEQIGKIGEELAERFHLQAAVITGIEYEKETQAVKAGTEEVQTQMGNLVVENGVLSWYFARKEGSSYSGTGDFHFKCRPGAGNVHDGLRETGSGFSLQSNFRNRKRGNRPERWGLL